MTNKTKIKKILIISAYFIFFWIILPWAILYSSSLLDNTFALKLPFSYFRLVLGCMIALFSAGMLFLSIFQLKKYGHGLPISALPPKKLARKGVFLIWRHPIYLFFTLFFAGLALVVRSGSMILIILPLFIAMEAINVIIEEKFLVKRYGKTYEYYKSTTSLVVPKFYHFLRVLGYLPFKLLFSLKIHNKENIPEDKGFFILSSHRNYLDPFFIIQITARPVHFVATYEIFRRPLSRFIFNKLHCIPKKRYLPDIQAAKQITGLINRGAITGIFYGGRRSWTGSPDSFKPEVLKMLKAFNHIPVLPLKIDGNYLTWPRWSNRLRRADISITVQKPFYIDENQSFEEIEEQLKKVAAPDDSGLFCKSKKLAEDIPIVIYRCAVCRSFKTLDITGKAQFRCHDCRTVFTILPDYNIVYYIGKNRVEKSIDSLYNRIRIRENDIEPVSIKTKPAKDTACDFAEDVIARCDKAVFFVEKKTKLVKTFTGPFFLSKNSITMTGEQSSIQIDLEAITSVTIESNDRLQLYTGKQGGLLYQFKFPAESALMWQDYILVTIKYAR